MNAKKIFASITMKVPESLYKQGDQILSSASQYPTLLRDTEVFKSSSSSSSSISHTGIMPICWALGDMLDWAEGTFWFLASALLLLPFFFLFLSPFLLLIFLFFSSFSSSSFLLLFPPLYLLLSNLLLFLFFLLPLLPFLLLHLLPVPLPLLNSSIFHPYPSYIPSYN